MRYEWLSRVCPIFSLMSVIPYCRDVLFDDGHGMGMGLIDFFILVSSNVKLNDSIAMEGVRRR